MAKRLRHETHVIEGQCIKIVRSSGNVFADLGLENSEELLTKAEFSAAIRKTISSLKLTQVAAATRLNIDRRVVSQLVNGQVDDYKTDDFIRILNELGCNITITVRKPSDGKKRGRVIFG